MEKVFRLSKLPIYGAILLFIVSATASIAQSPPTDDEAILQELTQDSAAKCVELAAQIPVWRQDIRTAQAAFQAADVATLEPLERLLKQLDSVLAQLPANLKPFVGDTAELKRVLLEADAVWKNAKFDPEKNADVTEDKFRENAKREAYTMAGEKFSEIVEADVFAKVQRLQDAAAIMTKFFEGELRNWMSKPQKVPGTDLILKVLPPDKNVSVFSPQANIGVAIEYLPSKLTVRATGLYFKYEPGGVPSPAIDKLKVDPTENVKGRVIGTLKALGEEITESMGLPLNVTLTGDPDFTSGGAIEFTLEVTLVPSPQPIKAKAEGLKLYPNGKVKWQQGTLVVKYPLETGIPLGTTPLALWEINGGYEIKPPKMSIGGKISSIAPTSRAMSLDVTLMADIPIKKIGVTGAIVILNGGEVAKLKDASIDFSRGEVIGSFISDSPVPGLPLVASNGQFELRSEVMLMNGSIELFGLKVTNADLAINFQDGSSQVACKAGFKLFGAECSDQWTGEIRPGFKSIRFQCVQSVEVHGVQPYGDIYATVTVTGDTAKGKGIDVEVETFIPGLKVKKTVDSLSECTMDNLQKWLKENAVDAYHQFLQELANGEKEGREWAAKLDKKTRQYVSDRIGGAWQTNNTALNALGSQLADEYKNVNGAATDLLQPVVGAVSDLTNPTTWSEITIP